MRTSVSVTVNHIIAPSHHLIFTILLLSPLGINDGGDSLTCFNHYQFLEFGSFFKRSGVGVNFINWARVYEPIISWWNGLSCVYFGFGHYLVSTDVGGVVKCLVIKGASDSLNDFLFALLPEEKLQILSYKTSLNQSTIGVRIHCTRTVPFLIAWREADTSRTITWVCCSIEEKYETVSVLFRQGSIHPSAWETAYTACSRLSGTARTACPLVAWILTEYSHISRQESYSLLSEHRSRFVDIYRVHKD